MIAPAQLKAMIDYLQQFEATLQIRFTFNPFNWYFLKHWYFHNTEDSFSLEASIVLLFIAFEVAVFKSFRLSDDFTGFKEVVLKSELDETE